MPDTINFTPDKVRDLERAYAQALELKSEAFTFEGRVLLTSYAKYLLEYLHNTMK